MIGVFDSGAGGLTVVKEIRRLLPEVDLVYFGDTARFPYGNQSPSLLRRYAEEDAALLVAKGATVIVVACNSASAAAGAHLKATLVVPVFDVIGPAVAEARRRTTHGRIGVIGTKATVASGIYERLLAEPKGRYTVIARAASLLVPLVEERWWKHPESIRIIRRYLQPLKQAQVDTLVLACTHYPFLQPILQRVMGKRVAVVNPAEATAELLRQYLIEHPDAARSSEARGALHCYVSSDPQHFSQTARWWLGEKVEASEAQTNELAG